MMINRLKRIYRFWFKNPPKVSTSKKTKIERHGNDYGGWNIMRNSINSNSIVYSIGIGNDISFDISIINKYHCKIFAYDPTPEVNNWINQQQLPESFIFQPIGLSNIDGLIEFYEPKNKDHISHSAIDLGNSNVVLVPAMTLKSLMQQNHHTQIDLLKMDIEGFEYNVIENLIANRIRPKQLLIEFHHFYSQYGNKKTEDAIGQLLSYGYDLINISDSFCEYSFYDNDKNQFEI